MEKYSLRHTIQQGFNGLFYIFRKELKATIKDQGVLIFFLLVPLAYPLIYAFIYTNEVVREVPTAVIDASNSSLSRNTSAWLTEHRMYRYNLIVPTWKKPNNC